VSRSAQEIQDWMIDRLSRLTRIPAHKIDPRQPIRRLGLDSVALVAFVTDLMEWVGYRYTDNPLADHPTLEGLAAFLSEDTARDEERTG
jgi:acyl carrier protein